ncbi:MFS family permease [Chitinophaga terrae (ex Kim and Jung 2007)]|nr:MFS family permease [Chitinophaga terrae (ex Kim and Jung 2007)]
MKNSTSLQLPRKQSTPSTQNIWQVILASSAGTLIEWYDFYIFGSLAAIIAEKFFPPSNPTLAYIATLATFAVGFIVRPFGAIVFGRLGDMVGRKYTFLLTLILMGGSTFAIGLIPSYHTIGVLAPILVLILRLLQGLALGGEYGGAATYVAEHSPNHRRGYYTSFIQTTATLGLFVSLGVILLTRMSMTPEDFNNYGWRIPFLLSVLLVLMSYYIRIRLHESPLFAQIKRKEKPVLILLKKVLEIKRT